MVAPVVLGDTNFILLDTGANVDPKPEYVLQFAVMGSIYKEVIYGIKNPKVGLLNVGTEETKGNNFSKETYNYILENKDEYGINFIRKYRS